MADPLDPFSYAEQANPRNRQFPSATQSAPADPVIAEIRRQRDRDLHLDIQLSPNADEVGRASRLARQAGVPPTTIEDRLDDAERAQNAQRLTGLMNSYPAIGKWAATNTRGAIAAQDDHESLGILGRAWETLKGIPGALEAGYQSAAAGMNDLYLSIDEALLPFTNPSGGRQILDREASYSAAYRRNADAARPKTDNFYVRSILQGFESVPSSLTATAVGIATRSPGLAATTMGVTTAAPAYREALAKGKGTGDALRYGVEQGLIEALTEKIPASHLLTDLTVKTPFGQMILRQLATEMPGEQVATALQDFSTWVNLNPDKPFSSYLEERPEAALATALATISGTTAQTGAAHVTERAATTIAGVAAKRQQATQAKREAGVIDQAGKAAETSKLRMRDPDAFRAAMREAANDAGATHVYLPGEAVQAYMQSDSYDPDRDPFSAYSDEISEAALSGGDFVMPVEDALSLLPGTPAWAALKDDMRLSAGGMSARDAETFETSMADVMAELSDRMDKADKEAKAQRGAIEKLTDTVAQKLQDAGFTPHVARVQAEVLAQRASVRAARMGQELTGEEYGSTEVRQVLPPALAAAKKADATDLVINAMRKGGAAMQQGGDTLLQFIAKRGGINDSGGDLASMGVDKWHRGKVGQKKAIRPFDPQASMGGVTGAGDYGVDNTLRAAIEAGYFPELAGAMDEAGASTLDTQTLLDAIGEEMSGSPRYASEAKVDPMRAAAEELRELLSDAGLDPASMSDVELRAAIERLDEAGPDGGFNQAAFHGSPHIFDRFSTEAIGTGEGAQVYGWGLYFTSRKGIAEHYRDVLSEPTLDGREMRDNEWAAFQSLTEADNDIDKAIATLEDRIARETVGGRISILSGLPLELATLKAWKKDPPKIEKPGRVYQVEIPDDGEFLLWDKPLSDQPEMIREQVKWAWDEAVLTVREKRREVGIENPEAYNPTMPEDGGHIYERLGQMMGSDKAASLALKDLGIAGIKYLDGGSRADGDGTHNYVVFDDSRVSIQSYEQSFGDGPRGRITFPEAGFGTGPTVIELFQSRNLSTFLHETGHQWLEELRFDAQSEGAPDQLKADWQAVQDWFKANKIPVKDGVIPVEAHELWARGVERFLMEGKAPSSALQRLFETFRGWLISIYKTVDSLRAPISPEIREVMGRLVATDEEIKAAADEQALSPLFTDAAAAGMSGPEFDAYTQQVASARGAAQGALLEKTMAAIRRRETAKYREARQGVEAEETEIVDARPVFRALRLLKTDRISRQWIADEFGVDALDLLPVRVPPIYKDGGAHPTTIAEMAGYSSGKEMIEALIGAEQAHRQAKEGGDQRSMREREIANATDAEMNRRYGDPLNDGSIEREALAAVHNDMQGEVIASEIRILARSSGRRATPYSIAKAWARNKVRTGTYAAEASPAAIQRHARSAAKAGREAEKAMLAGNAEEALRFKQQQMLSSALLSEAKAANDEANAARDRMRKIAERRTSKSIDQEYLEQAHALLEAVDMKARSQKSIERQGKWAEWAAAREAEGYDIVVPPTFEATLGTTHWTRLPVETLLGLDETVKQIVHLGRLKQSLLDNQDRREWDAVIAEAVDGAGGLNQKPPRDLMEPGWAESFSARIAAMDAGLLKMETVFDWLDGGNSNGVFNRIAFRPVADAQARENDMVADYFGRIRTLFEGISAPALKRWSDVVVPPFTNRETGLPERLARKQLIAAALNTGNAGNLQRLTDGYGWNADALQNYLATELTAEEWQFVQGVWDTIETLWPEIEAMEKRVNGIAPDKVEPTEIVTPHGTLRGGYYPAIYDDARDLVTEERRGRETDLFESLYTRASTRASATKARAEKVSRPILLDLGAINRHLGEVIHDVTHREAVMQAHRFLTDRRVAAAVDQALGSEIRKSMRPWVKFVANSWAMERAGNEGIGKFFGKLRANATAVGMGFRISTAMTQIAGFSNSFEAVGEKWVSEAIARSAADPIGSFNFVMERSGEVRHRMDTLDRDIRTAIHQTPLGKLGEVKRFMFHGIGYMDRVVVVPTWLGAYNKAMAGGMSEADAIYAADKAVRQSQGAGSPKDLAAIQRGTGKWGELLKAFTMFYSYFSAAYQRNRTLGRDAMGRDSRRTRDLPRLVARAWWLLVVPAVLPDMIKIAMGANGGPDDDEWWVGWTFKKLLANSLGAIPGVRDLIEPAWDKAAGNKTFGYSLSPLQRIGETFVNTAGDAGKLARGEDTKQATRNVLESLGYATGLVPGQIAAATQFLVDLGQGDANPKDFSDWMEGLMTGRIKD